MGSRLELATWRVGGGDEYWELKIGDLLSVTDIFGLSRDVPADLWGPSWSLNQGVSACRLGRSSFLPDLTAGVMFAIITRRGCEEIESTS